MDTEIAAAELKRLDARTEKLETALRGVVNHWREFGEMIVLNNAVNRDDYGFDERVEDAARLIDGAATPIEEPR